MHQFGMTAVPFRRFIFHWAVADSDNQIRLTQQPIARLVIKQSDTARKAREVRLGDGAGRLIGTGHRNMAALQQTMQCGGVMRLAGHQAQQDNGVFRFRDFVGDGVDRAFRRGTEQQLACGRQHVAAHRTVDNILRQTDESAAGTAQLRIAERIGYDFAQRIGRAHFHRIFGDRAEHTDGIHALMDQLGAVRAFHRAAQRHNRVAFRGSGRHAGDQVGAAGTGGHQRHARLAGQTSYRRRHKRRVRFMANRNGLDRRVHQRIENFIYFSAGNAEHLLHALRLQLGNNQIGAVRPFFLHIAFHCFSCGED